jgi:hypothetical protein
MNRIIFLFALAILFLTTACEKENFEPTINEEPVEQEVDFRAIACTDAGVYKAGANLLYAFCDDGTFIRVLKFGNKYYEHGTTLGDWELLPNGNPYLDFYSPWTSDKEYYHWSNNQYGNVYEIEGPLLKTLIPQTANVLED